MIPTTSYDDTSERAWPFGRARLHFGNEFRSIMLQCDTLERRKSEAAKRSG